MTPPLTFVELCAGAGGLSLGLERAGWECRAHAELAEFPRRILRHHWPRVPLYGDIEGLSGYQLVADVGRFTMLSGGTPCQDLSIAGRREGLEGARSGLFYQQIRIWRESGAPLCLWENVDGAYSSNDGRDFAAVLSAFVGAAVPVPRDGWTGERRSGVVSGPTGVAAWRLLDAQYFGVPQRRARVFVLGSRAPGFDPAEVLLEPEGVCWDSPPIGGAREAVAASTRGGASIDGGRTPQVASPITTNEHRTFDHTGKNPRPRNLVVVDQPVLAFDYKQSARDASVELSPTLRALQHRHGNANGGSHVGVVTFNETGHERWTEEPVAGSLNAHEAKEAHTVVLSDAVAFKPSHYTRGKDGAPSETMPPLTADADKGDQDPVVLQVVGTLRATDGGSDVDHARAGHILAGRVRRLTPLECERVMGWDDQWTNVPDEKGKAPADSNRYRACGNGVVSHVTHWLGLRARHHLEKP